MRPVKVVEIHDTSMVDSILILEDPFLETRRLFCNQVTFLPIFPLKSIFCEFQGKSMGCMLITMTLQVLKAHKDACVYPHTL